MIELSVIVAAQDAGPGLRERIAALTAQLEPDRGELLVPHAGASQAIAGIARDFPNVRWIECPAFSPVPKLWSAGIIAAQGRIVALTIENCVPAPDWSSRMLALHERDCAAAGGAIDLGDGSIVDWAVYFCRYSASMPPFAARYLDDLAGDNVSYKRHALDAVRPLMADGFWETLIHDDMRRRGEKLLSDPSAAVTFQGGIGAMRFLRRRFLHGRRFAAERASGWSAGSRLARAAAFPLTAAVLLRRITSRVFGKRRHRARFVAALPWICVFLLAWSAGEAAGYLGGRSAAGPIERD